MPQLQRTDKTLFYTTVCLSFFGLVMVYSASSVMAQIRYHSQTHFFSQQAIALVVALVAMMLLKRTHYRKLQNASVAFASVGVSIMLLLAVYAIDTRAHRWLRMGGVSIQPAELAKPAIVLFLAYFVTLRARAINNKYTLWPAFMSVGLLTFAVAIADFGTAVVIGATAAAVIFVAGLERRYLLMLAAVGLVGGFVFVVSKPYRLARIIQYVDPQYEALKRVDSGGQLRTHLQKSMATRDTTYQGEQSKIAVGAGGATGLGLMQSKQKLFYLPEAHTDFIYAVVCEELGLIGSLAILTGFGLIIWRGLRATVRSQDDFARYLALGITIMITVQAFMNISVVLGLGPPKGIPLPMISAGGNSLLSTLAMLGMLMNVSENAA